MLLWPLLLPVFIRREEIRYCLVTIGDTLSAPYLLGFFLLLGWAGIKQAQKCFKAVKKRSELEQLGSQS